MSSAGRLEMKMDVNGVIVELSEILRAIRGREEMSWLMVDLWAIQDPHATFPVSDIEDEIERSPHGLRAAGRRDHGRGRRIMPLPPDHWANCRGGKTLPQY